MVRAHRPLLGRHAEMVVLESELADARRGRPGLVIVSGEAGIGKTRLLDELATVADGDGFLTVRGRGSELEAQRPYGLYVDALDAYLASLEEKALDRLQADRLGALAEVFPSLRGLEHAVDYPSSVTERFRAHYAVRDLLERLAVRQPLLLVLDDVQWADGASLELTSYLMRNPPDGEVVMALAARSRQGGPAVAGIMATARRLGHGSHVDLTPLDRESVEELVADAAGADVERLWQLSGGNPFYALQLARSGITETQQGDHVVGVPSAVANAIDVELGGLTPLERSVVDAAAVAGDPFDLDLVVEASGRTEDEVLHAIDVLLSMDLVREAEVPRRFQFRHPIVHRAVYATCRPSVKVACHRGLVVALTRRGASPTALAAHVEQSSRHGDEAAVEVLRRAAAEAALNAPASSVRWLRAALRLTSEGAPPSARSALLDELAMSQAALGRFADARSTLEECLELGAATSSEEQVALIVRCAEMEQLMGRHAESRDRLEKAYRDLDVPVSTAGVSLLVALTAASLFLSEQQRMLEWGRMAVAAASGLGDDALLAAALAAHAMGAAFASEEGAEAVEAHDRCSRMVDSMPDETVVRRLDALSNLTMSELYLDRHVLGCEHGERALMLARAAGQTHLLPTLSPILGMSLAMVGQMERSAQVLDDAIEAARLVGDAQGLCMNLFNRELSAVLAGDIDTALGLGGESLELAREVDSGVITAFAGAIHAQAVLESGDPRAAVDLLLDSVGGEEIPLLAGSWRAHFLEVLTRCLLGVGDPEGAGSAAERLRDQSQRYTLGLTRLMAHRAAAEVALAQRRLDEAVRSARGALREAEGIEARAHIPVTRALLGRSLAAQGSEGVAVEQLVIAAEEFEGLGAARHRSAVESELRRLGHTTAYHRSTPGKRDGSGVEALTGREMEVAQLVLDRKTNREIANELFLSTKTVESHIRNIFTKLGVSSRAEIARIVAAARNG